MKKIIIFILLCSCNKIEDKITPQTQIQDKINLAVYEDTSDIGEVLIVEIEDEAQFKGSEEMIRPTNCYSLPDSIRHN